MLLYCINSDMTKVESLAAYPAKFGEDQSDTF